MNNFLLKIFIFFTLLILGGFFPGVTSAYFWDKKSTGEITLTTGVLEFSLEGADEIQNEEDVRVIKIENTGTLPFVYSVEVEKGPAEEDSFCKDLRVALNGEGMSFNVSKLLGALEAGKAKDFSFKFSVENANDNYSGKSCEVSFVYKAWQENLEYGKGFFATKANSFQLDGDVFVENANETEVPKYVGVVINEIYPNPKNEGEDLESKEWVEIYNGSEQEVDIEGWLISEISGSSEKKYTIKKDYDLSDNAYAYLNKTIIPANEFTIILFNSKTAKLNDGGDTVRLYNSEGSLFSETGYKSYVTSSGNKGKTWARIPDGSDDPNDWKDFCLPTPGAPNDCGEGSVEGTDLENLENLLQIFVESKDQYGEIKNETKIPQVLKIIPAKTEEEPALSETKGPTIEQDPGNEPPAAKEPEVEQGALHSIEKAKDEL